MKVIAGPRHCKKGRNKGEDLLYPQTPQAAVFKFAMDGAGGRLFTAAFPAIG